ncbi:extensin isoform X2 [Drosophila elegans]|uniref:extensin isoform X2 n=1 Tax=Drosophila elegans TaxID=30023 RepID=UPI0007E735E4|nr:extensin isoform X2 [Drosophila elegans]
MESALDVLSRAATMVQNNPSEMRVTAKELPTTKWRRERRQRTAEYPVHEAGNSDREREREREDRDMDSPIDMSVTTGALKLRASPPPPYREPLPGTNYAANSRPSVITQAPPKREPPEQAHSSDVAMCDIDEHFRRSLGENYAALFAKKSPTPTPTPTPSPSGTPKQQVSPLTYGPPSSSSSSTGAAGATTTQLYHQQQQQQHRSPLAKPGLVILEPESEQPELPPPQEEPLPLSLALHRTQAPPSPPPSATGSGPALPAAVSQVMEAAVAAKRILDTPHHTPPRYNTPPPPPAYAVSPGTAVTTPPTLTPTPTPIAIPIPTISTTPTPNLNANPNPTPSQIPTPTASMPAIIRVKAEPGLAAVAASSTQTPPASPTSSTNISIFTKTEASVDDHFAKALGDTWKKLQGGHNKE